VIVIVNSGCYAASDDTRMRASTPKIYMNTMGSRWLGVCLDVCGALRDSVREGRLLGAVATSKIVRKYSRPQLWH
jgi:hypothetical protein